MSLVSGTYRATSPASEHLVDAEFDELKREFLAEAAAKIDEICSILKESRSPQTRERMLYLAHQLKGAGGSYGFQLISTEAELMEKILEESTGDINDSSVEKLGKHIENLANEVNLRATQLAVIE